MVVAPTMVVVKRGVLIGSIVKLGNQLGGVSIGKKISGNTTLPATSIGVIKTPQMVFSNLIMTTHVNRTINRPLMSLMTTRRYISVDVVNPKGGYRKPSTVIAPIPDHKDGHYVRPNRVAFKYLDFKKMLIQMLMSESLIL
jgi:hypothetical protein